MKIKIDDEPFRSLDKIALKYSTRFEFLSLNELLDKLVREKYNFDCKYMLRSDTKAIDDVVSFSH
jgi:hypothetical protein